MIALQWLTQKLIELQQYLRQLPAYSKAAKSEGVIEFWKTHRSQYPSLSKVALDLISCPASRACVKRTFPCEGFCLVEDATGCQLTLK
jgi:hypothetical protein